MRKQLLIPIACIAAVLAGANSYGEVEAPSLKWGGFASLREGQIVKGEPETIKKNESPTEFVWVQEMNVGLSLQAAFKNVPAVGHVGAEIAVLNDNSPYEGDLGVSRRLHFYPFLSRADLVINALEGEYTNLTFDLGYFPYKYNSSVRNLGEYLFRSGTYPQYLITEVDFPQARLMGIRAGGTLWKNLKWDFLLTTNMEWTAIGDINLSALLAWQPHPVFELGLGGSWCDFLSVFGLNLDKTSPAQEGNDYIVDGKRYYYTFAGQKLMGRMTLDIKKAIPGWENIFGEEDLKLYSEAAILGLINYPLSVDSLTQYDTLWQRIPVMFGLNIPTFKLLDVLSFEVEWFGSPYPNSTNTTRFDNTPIPLSSYGNERTIPAFRNLHEDDWKWSVYAKRTIMNNFYIMAQAARDHIRWYRLDYTTMDGKEALRKNDEWHYTFKFGYSF